MKEKNSGMQTHALMHHKGLKGSHVNQVMLVMLYQHIMLTCQPWYLNKGIVTCIDMKAFPENIVHSPDAGLMFG